ncbi:MAG: hypothetical protein ACK5Z5_04140 [Neisseriaceae bacterium]|jgi:hypothetical protein
MDSITIQNNLKLRHIWWSLKQSFRTFFKNPLKFLFLQTITTIVVLIPLLGAFFAPLFTARYMYCADKLNN